MTFRLFPTFGYYKLNCLEGTSLCINMFSFLWDTCPGAQLPGGMVAICVVFKQQPKCLPGWPHGPQTHCMRRSQPSWSQGWCLTVVLTVFLWPSNVLFVCLPATIIHSSKMPESFAHVLAGLPVLPHELWELFMSQQCSFGRHVIWGLFPGSTLSFHPPNSISCRVKVLISWNPVYQCFLFLGTKSKNSA